MYIVDSETFQKNIKDVAEFLFQILTDKSINKISPKVCIACNKQGKFCASTKYDVSVLSVKVQGVSISKSQMSQLKSTFFSICSFSCY